ncbi:hypothetical protein L208DRAFT_1457858 [Tricholoma matsutake]|nr:hypothetical protein L208DRAFT_1457858 [Tricholoma matsutake 945]
MAIDNSMGAMLIGTLMSSMLLGITYVQSFYYFIEYRMDPWYLKSLVISTVVLDTAQMLLISYSIYRWLITDYNNPIGLEPLLWSGLVEPLPTALTSMLVQGFFTLRVWHRCTIAWIILSMQLEKFTDLRALLPLVIVVSALSVGADVIISASLVILLSRARTAFKRSNTIINKLMLFVINTGVLTSCIAIACLISVLAWPTSMIYASFYFCLGRSYVNSLLAILNGRKHIAEQVDNVSHMLVSMPTSVTSPSHSLGKVQPNISILVNTRHEQDGLQDDHGKNYDLES